MYLATDTIEDKYHPHFEFHMDIFLGVEQGREKYKPKSLYPEIL